MDFNKFFRSKTFKMVLLAIAALVVLLFVFKTGVFVGYRKAEYSYRWGENYHRNFAGPREGFFGDFRRGFFIGFSGGLIILSFFFGRSLNEVISSST